MDRSDPRPRPRPGPGVPRLLLLAAGTALVALLSPHVAAALLASVALGLTAPTLRRRIGLARPGPAPRTPQHRAAPPAWADRGLSDDATAGADDAGLAERPAPGLTTAELCRAWRHSFVALRGARTPGERARLAALRQSYLDEIESRDPAAMQAWFASGARAASGPERFLAPRRPWPRDT